MSAVRSPDLDSPRPSLRQRGGELRAGIARVVRRPSAPEGGGTHPVSTLRAEPAPEGEAAPGPGCEPSGVRDHHPDLSALVAAQAPGDTAADLGRRLARNLSDYDALDTLVVGASPHTPKPDAETADAGRCLMRRLDDHAAALREAISHRRAATLADALAQLVVIGSEVDRLWQMIEGDSADAIVARVERLTYSLREFLAAQGGLDPMDFGSGHLLPAYLDRLAPDHLHAEMAALLGPRPEAPLPPTRGAPWCAVEEQLVALDAQIEAWVAVYAEAADTRSAAQSTVSGGEAAERVADMAVAHALRISRTLLIRSLDAPATTIRGLGLQARAMAADLHDWWHDTDLPPGETACRILLDRLIGLAGLVPIEVRDVTTAEARD